MSKVLDTSEVKNRFLSEYQKFEGKLNGGAETKYHSVRKEALAKFIEMDFPTVKDEEWKYTNVSSLLKNDFVFSFNSENPVYTKEDIKPWFFENVDTYKAVFVNGIFSEELSELEGIPEGVIVKNLNSAVKENSEVIEQHVSKLAKIENAFNALNTAFAFDGMVVIVPDGKVVEKPVEVLFINGHGDVNVFSNIRNIIIAGDNSQVRIINTYKGNSKKPYFTNTMTEVYSGQNAIVDLYKNQHEDEELGYHIDKTEAYQLRGSRFSHYNMSFGGSLVRNDINSMLDAEGIQTDFYGLFLINGSQHFDVHSYADHAKPHCESNELYKGILDDKARGVFNGKIMVRQDAQKTNAYQSNQNVLLSEAANIDTKPQLEIFADDVKCSHGATVGQMDAEALAYIRSRGIPEKLAQSMLIRAFCSEVVEAVRIEELKESFNHMIFEKLHREKI